mgnify:FL=1
MSVTVRVSLRCREFIGVVDLIYTRLLNSVVELILVAPDKPKLTFGSSLYIRSTSWRLLLYNSTTKRFIIERNVTDHVRLRFH